jgi:uncharacterized Fe-S cluster-containing radical SAM superfamily enzyme
MTRCNGVAAVAAIIGQIKDAGLDHIQLSFQNSTKKMNGFLTGTKSFDCKSRVAKLIKHMITRRCSTQCCIATTSIMSSASSTWR